jgi:predicted Zn-dependent protease
MDSVRFTPQRGIQFSRAEHTGQTSQQSEQQNAAEDGDPRQDEFCQSEPDEDDLPLDEELGEGDRQEQELLGEYRRWHDAEAGALLAEFLATLVNLGLRTDLHYRFWALDTPRPLAASCANGAVYFSRAVLENLASEQVLFLAAHEIAHTEMRHYATRRRRLSELRRCFAAPPGSAARQRMEQAAVLAVRHQEELEADYQGAVWLDFGLADRALSALGQLCRRVSPESLQHPSHPAFELRVDRMRLRLPTPAPLDYLHSLIT